MKIGLIAGSGQFPVVFSKAARSKGFSIYAVAYKGEAGKELETHVDVIEWIYLGQVERLIKFFHKNGIDQAVMLGAIGKTSMFSDVKPDAKAISLITKMADTHDDNLLRVFAGALEEEGICIQASTFLLPDIFAEKGCWTKRMPSEAETADMKLGFSIAKEIGYLDIGQCVVVGGGSVLAVEAIDGTDATIERGGKLGQGHAVVVKVSKPEQDLRFDVPAVGVQTIETMHGAGSTALAVESGKTIVFDKQEMVRQADQHDITIVGL